MTGSVIFKTVNIREATMGAILDLFRSVVRDSSLKERKPSNAMRVIFPYRLNNTWVFDDETVGLVREPFVFGIPEMIDIFIGDIKEAEYGFKLLFSDNSFPGFQAELTWLREDYGGNWYRLEAREGQQGTMEGWLCPAMFKYFDVAPDKIFCRVEPKQ
ncbi:MAG: DUF6717 family protein [Beijerinckiaceae bacterium]